MKASIPIIDLADHEEQILPTLERALCDIGFVLVKGHGVPAELVTDLRQHLVDFFDRSLADKMAEHITPDNYRGYIPLGFFSPNTEGVTPDQYEGYKLHAEVAADDRLEEHLVGRDVEGHLHQRDDDRHRRDRRRFW